MVTKGTRIGQAEGGTESVERDHGVLPRHAAATAQSRATGCGPPSRRRRRIDLRGRARIVPARARSGDEVGRRARRAGRVVRHLPRRFDAAVRRLCGGEAPRGRRLQRRGAEPDLLRPACLQHRRSRDDARPRRARHRELPRLRLRRRAVGLVRRHDQGALSRAFHGRPELGAARERARRPDLRADELPRRRARRHRRRGAAFRGRSPTTIPARACASSASRGSRGGSWRAFPASSSSRWRIRTSAAASAAPSR